MNAPTAMNLGMRPEDIRAFKRCAQECAVYILVRMTNEASLQYIAREGFHPKPINCKPKTADFDVTFERRHAISWPIYCSGLVVDPTLPGMNRAFSEHKYRKAIKAWGDFRDKVAVPDPNALGRGVYTQLAGQRRYAVQLDPNSHQWGCLMYTPGSFPRPLQRKTVEYRAAVCRMGQGLARFYDPCLPNGCHYLHGDYDLYGIVDAIEPSKNQILEGRLNEGEHTFGPRWWIVQHKLNDVLLDAPMIQHGSQDTYIGHQNEPVIVFYPDGQRVLLLRNKAEIEQLYRDEFGGRVTVVEQPSPIYNAHGRRLPRS